MNATQTIIQKIVLIGTLALALTAQAQSTSIGIAPPPTDLKQVVDLAGTYVYESANLRFWLNVNHDFVAYPLDDQNISDVCGVNATGEYCKPIALMPQRPYDPNRYIAHLQTNDCWGTSVALTSNVKHLKAKISKKIISQKGHIVFNPFLIWNNVGIIPIESQVVYSTLENDTALVNGSNTKASLPMIESKECRQAHTAAALLEKAKAFQVSKSDLLLQLQKGRILRLKRVDTYTLPLLAQ